MNFKIFLLLFFVINVIVHGQYNGNDFSIGGYGLYTTSAAIFLNPNAPDIALRNKSFDIVDLLNPGFEIRYRVSDPLIIGLNVDYYNVSQKSQNLSVFFGNTVALIETDDGFIFIPVELTAYYLLPFSTESFKFLMGAGGGYYNGEFKQKLSSAEVTNVSKESAFGIHVSISMEYIITNNIFARLQMKFRDPEFKVSSKYNQDEVIYEGRTLQLPDEPFNTKINVDGIVFLVGLSFQF